jgi:hypothetical protein
MDFQEEPMYEPPSDFVRSAALFIFTMGTVFGLGMLWTNYGDDIAARWNKDWSGMKNGWAKATTPPEKKPGSGGGLFSLMQGGPWGPNGFGHEMRPADNRQLRSDRPVVPMVDKTKLKLSPVKKPTRR